MEQLLKDINNFENRETRRNALSEVIKIMKATGKVLATKDPVSALVSPEDFDPQNADSAWRISDGRFVQIPIKKPLSECMFVKF